MDKGYGRACVLIRRVVVTKGTKGYIQIIRLFLEVEGLRGARNILRPRRNSSELV